ncbi:hypothetical protein J6590_033702 [Homalodisca vitripennis]|nr:hypothetical protein J6590_033702 [Homalodisca vitripennis]
MRRGGDAVCRTRGPEFPRIGQDWGCGAWCPICCYIGYYPVVPLPLHPSFGAARPFLFPTFAVKCRIDGPLFLFTPPTCLT